MIKNNHYLKIEFSKLTQNKMHQMKCFQMYRHKLIWNQLRLSKN